MRSSGTRNSGLRSEARNGWLDRGTAGTSRRNYQSLLHRRNVGATQLYFRFMQLLWLRGLVISLDQQFHAEGTVLIFFEVRDGFLVLLLFHQQSSGCALI